MTPARIRQKLKRLGVRRERSQRDAQVLHRDTIEGLELAEGVISTTEAANLVGLSRSTVYEVYRGGRAARRAKE